MNELEKLKLELKKLKKEKKKDFVTGIVFLVTAAICAVLAIVYKNPVGAASTLVLLTTGISLIANNRDY